MTKRTMEDYTYIGHRLKNLSRDFVEIVDKISANKHKTKHRRLLDRVMHDLLELRSELEDEMMKDYPDASLSVFYGMEEGDSK